MRREQWHLTEGLLFLHFAVFLLTYTNPQQLQVLMLIPGTVAARPWTVVTFQFIHGSMISFFFSMIVLWIMARPIEESWGSPRFLLFWAISIFGAVGTALMFGQPLAGDVFLSTSLLFTFATLSPDTEFLLFLILPVKVKWLAIFGGALLLLSSFKLGLFAGIANAVGMSAGYVYFLLTRNLPARHQVAFKLKKRRAEVATAVENVVAEQRNAAWDESVRASEELARSGAPLGDKDNALLAELDDARDPSLTVCAPEDFGYTDDPVCRTCDGYAECAARRIRLAAGEGEGTSR